MEQDLILEVRNLNTYYTEGRTLFGDKGKRMQVLKDVSFEMYEGEIVGLVGESGSGKTTLSRAILGMLKDYEGEIVHYSERPQMVFQDPFSSLNPAHSIGWILEEPLRVQGKLKARQRKEAVIQVLEQVFKPTCSHLHRMEFLGQRQFLPSLHKIQIMCRQLVHLMQMFYWLKWRPL